jgi:acetate kinase
VFAGGIGENAPEIRARTCDGLGFLGLQLTEARHAANAAVMSADASRITPRAIRTDEELGIARAMERVLANVENSGI